MAKKKKRKKSINVARAAKPTRKAAMKKAGKKAAKKIGAKKAKRGPGRPPKNIGNA